MAWVTENGGRSGVMDLDRAELGIHELDEVVERYCAATGRDGVAEMNRYFAYNFFRLAGIMQGIKKRVIAGTASSRSEESRVGKEWLCTFRSSWSLCILNKKITNNMNYH